MHNATYFIMEKQTPNNSLRFCLTMVVWLILAGTISAQNIVSSSDLELSISWKTTEEAIPILFTQIENWHALLAQVPQGSDQYVDALRHAAYYKAIAWDLTRGEPVHRALENALPWAASLGGAMEASYTSKQALRALHAEARALLTN